MALKTPNLAALKPPKLLAKAPNLLTLMTSDNDGAYDGPYNPWLDHFHRIGANYVKLLALTTAMQRDTLHIYREVGKTYGEPKIVQRLQEYLEKVAAANVTLMEKLARDYEKPEFGLNFTTIDGHKVEVVEEVVVAKPFCNLIHFKRDTERNDPIVLIVAAQSGHYATLLRPTVERLLPEAEVYITDWLNAREVPLSAGEFNLDTYADYVVEFMDFLGPDTNVLAICQSTVPSVMAVARVAEETPEKQPMTFTVMAGPLDPGAAPTDVTKLADKMHLPSYLLSLIAQAPNGRKVYPGYVQLMSFIAMNPKNHFSSHRDLYNHYVTDDTHPDRERIERFYAEYFAVADLTAEFYADTVKRVFIDKELAKGTMTYNGKPVRPEAITCPIIAVEGAMDDISAPGQTKEYLKKFTGCEDITFYEQEHAGHYGVFAGGHWRADIAPRILFKIRETADAKGKEYSNYQTEGIPIEAYQP
ncbi:MAG: polyhydroxyalkanoate depolymerase [Austwickia sp.]|jgi:poly(3-hydroxybutyrate) depolymerase|nr:MAG: polyhydroxyalkanoate depolymerase [Austwickia sp.]